jgi:NADH:ubiquinone oxidoreductase subunit D
MYESVNIVFQILANLTNVSYRDSIEGGSTDSQVNFFNFFETLYTEKYNKLNYNTKYTSMESLINHFKHYSEGIKVPRGFTYKAVEAPKGEFGLFIKTIKNSNEIYKAHIKAPGFLHLGMLNMLSENHLLAIRSLYISWNFSAAKSQV